jgi:ferrous iron transport protein B
MDIPKRTIPLSGQSSASLTSGRQAQLYSGQTITIALAGNPNSGKTSIFNALTGARQHVGNYPGVTVEKKEGSLIYNGRCIKVVDLPGTYSLAAYSAEEIVARNFIIDERPDVVVDIVDCTNIERNLYLTTQLIELRVPLVIVLNMADVAQRKGMLFDIELLSQLLKAPIVQTIGTSGRGIERLLEAAIATARYPQSIPSDLVRYGPEIEKEIESLGSLIPSDHPRLADRCSRWLALKLLEHDPDVVTSGFSPEVLAAAAAARERLKRLLREDPDTAIAGWRYGFISGACTESVKSTVESRHDMTDRIDAVVTSRVFGLPIFAMTMYMVFYLTFKLGKWPMIGMEHAFGGLSAATAALWPVGSMSPLKSLIIDGVIGGVGGVIIFLPNILMLFLAIAILEDTGYMARAAFIMDRTMHRIGLHGKSFIPMIIGFGCTIPAILATRIIENRRNRFTTIMVTPLLSCGARLTIYSLIIPAFFAEEYRAPVLWLIYLIGIALAVIAAKLLRTTVLRGETTPFVMELPPYRVPTAKSLLIHMWERGRLYLSKAGTTILAVSIIMWAAASYPKPASEQLAGLTAEQVQTLELQSSLIGRLGKAIEPLIRPIGFDARIGTALLGAIAAKEVFVSQLSIVYSIGEIHGNLDVLRSALRHDYSPLQGFCIMLFCLISAPCIATFAVTRSETGKFRWAIAQWLGLTTLAYIVTYGVYQIGILIMPGV